ncbi:hypothetical protein EJ07DRAFT_156609 [Lizonia empirigonia]|nr:hypothetical protein EJ07DRAFT_156609 [Lizonia empirigonia]
MVPLSRFFVRSVVTSCTRTPTASTSATFRSHVLLSTSRVSSRQSLHTNISRNLASLKPSSVSEVATEPPVDSEWRHPRHGFTAADFPRLVHLNIPRKATEEDVKALVDRAGFPDAQIRVFYDLETGASACFCYLKLADEKQAIAAVSELSRFTLFDFEIRPAKYDAEKFPHWQQPSLFAGWKPSPSSDLNDRVVRPLLTTPPALLAPLLAEQWIKIENLPPIDLLRKETRFEIVHELYKKFHQYDVVGITKIQPGSRIQGWTCKIQFGSPKEAKAALHPRGHFPE